MNRPDGRILNIDGAGETNESPRKRLDSPTNRIVAALTLAVSGMVGAACDNKTTGPTPLPTNPPVGSVPTPGPSTAPTPTPDPTPPPPDPSPTPTPPRPTPTPEPVGENGEIMSFSISPNKVSAGDGVTVAVEFSTSCNWKVTTGPRLTLYRGQTNGKGNTAEMVFQANGVGNEWVKVQACGKAEQGSVEITP